MLFEYPYTCGTWFNRGKDVINEIEGILENNGLNIIPSVKPYHQGEFPNGYNGEFNIYIKNDGKKILVATSDNNDKFFHQGLKSFAYTYFETDPKTGERNYLAQNPERKDLLKFILNKVSYLLKSNSIIQNKNYYYD